LLVLDNCEQLLDPAYDLADRVLRECPGVRILATSREGLGVDGERVWPVRSLPLPDATGANVAASDAVTLFAERAEAAKATFTVDASNAAAVAEICRRLDGIPLAIELAAARVASMTPAEIRGLLDERFRLLTGGRRKGVERHQTLRATVDWSYSLLTESERIVFDRLGVFVGGFDAAGARAVVAGDGIEAWDVLDALTELVAKSMIMADDASDDTTRYQMLETLAQYARERLDETDSTDDWRRRHAEHYAAWAEIAGPGLEGPDEFVWRARETAELDNLRDAVTWALDRDDPDDTAFALRIIGALAFEANMNTAVGVGAWAERALPHAHAATPQLRYAITAAAAMHQQNLGNYERALELAQHAVDHGMPPGTPAPGMAHTSVSTCTLALGDMQRAMAAAVVAARLLDRDFPGSVQAVSAHQGCARLGVQSKDPLARDEAETALRIARRIANPSALALALSVDGWVRIADDPAAALAILDETIALHRQGAIPHMFGTTLCLTAGIRARTGDLPHAARDLREAVERAHQNNAHLTLYTALQWAVYVLVSVGRFDDAAGFDGMASAGLTSEYRAQPAWARIRDAIANARAAIGPDRYDAAFRTGAQMPHDQIVQHTLRILDDLIHETDPTATT
jgi:predicted ATPase